MNILAKDFVIILLILIELVRSCIYNTKKDEGVEMKKTRNFKPGFTLIELMVVLVILAILGVTVGSKIMDLPKKARVTTTIMNINTVEDALKLYNLDTGYYPTTEQGLKALITIPDIDPIPKGWKPGGYIDSSNVPKDAWDREFIYRSPTEEEEREYEVISLGNDGKEGGEDFNADIKSYELR